MKRSAFATTSAARELCSRVVTRIEVARFGPTGTQPERVLTGSSRLSLPPVARFTGVNYFHDGSVLDQRIADQRITAQRATQFPQRRIHPDSARVRSLLRRARRGRA